jgi:hypothetical protein
MGAFFVNFKCYLRGIENDIKNQKRKSYVGRNAHPLL